MHADYLYFASLTDLAPDVPADAILSRILHKHDQVNVTLFAFAAGQELSEHTATQPAILYFVEGEADLKLGADRLQARTGTYAYMPAHLPHSIHAKTRVVMLLLLLK
ncbi:MAG TPA: cupin domain-containing protein [Anaerolineae bacterium]|nr:cupin domain-containing protein [Anaerolineae bacterium]